MPSYESGTELIDAIIRQGNKFISEFGDIPDQYWDTLQPDVDDRTPRQMLAYQLGWMNLLLENGNTLKSRDMWRPCPPRDMHGTGWVNCMRASTQPGRMSLRNR